MLILKSRQELTDFVQSIRAKRLTIGFVPTMGALHEGHLFLIKKAIEENQYTLCSIFVNPTQFNNSADLEKYPRTEETDIKKLESAGCDAVYLPKVEDMYPSGFENDPIDLGGLDSVMEGAFRPGHFQGMATVVKRLLLQTQPTKAYFGEKDFQQLQIIRQMVRNEKLPVEIIGVPIVREESGLAMSSRNMRLSPEFKERSVFIYHTLLKAKELSSQLSPQQIISEVEKIYSNSDFKLEYFTIAEEKTLQTHDKFEENSRYRAFVAAFAGEIRLIDNIQIR
ncbi:MAG: pantoate--beta-alanine ligase [Flavobacteriaceae bacterium]|jgi:pantoate--beta-alanine ligase|nr:pantoate--beta-alanine ligase [Flavobacteriaceae bacterium]